MFDNFFLSVARYRFKSDAAWRTQIYNLIAAYTDMDMPIYETMESMRDDALHVKSYTAHAMFEEWVDRMENAEDFVDILSEYAPSSEAMLIISGAKYGDMGNAMRRAALSSSNAKEAKKIIMGSLMYPMGLVLMAIFMLVGVSLYVDPIISKVIPISKWPENSKSMHTLSVFVVHDGLQVLVVTIVFLTIIIMSVSRLKRSMIRDYLDLIPPWSVYRRYSASVFLVSLSEMMKLGTPIEQAITEISRQSSKYVKSHLEEMLARMQYGENYRYVLSTGMFPRDVYVMLRSFIRVKTFDEVIGIMGDDARKEGLENIKKTMKVLTAVLLIAVTGFTVWLGSAFFGLTMGSASAMSGLN